VSENKNKNPSEMPEDERPENNEDKDPSSEDILEIVSGDDGPQDENGRQRDRIAALEKQLESEKKEQLYLRAEFDTYRRRAIKEKSDLLKYSGEKAFVAFLGILDNFERALQIEPTGDNFESYKNGVKLIADEMRNLLKREGVEEVLPKNDGFDPHVFEAIGSEESTEKAPGQITRILRKAYRLHDRIIRPGQAIVAKAPSDKNKSDDESGDGSSTDEK